ncbi:MAG: DUF87 domain-containing protein [Patescibacteria group bacterium]
MTEDGLLPFFIFTTIVFAGVVGYIVFALRTLQTKTDLNYSLNLVLLLVAVPLHKTKELQGEEIKKLIGVMEQFYAGIGAVREGWLKGMFRGPSALSFEMVLPSIGEEVHFYLCVPRKYVELAEKQITGFLPDARIESVPEYNIFNPVGASAGSYLTLAKSFFLPVKTYRELETDPLNFIANAMSKLSFHGEGCAVQVIIKPNATWNSEVREIISAMRQGKSFSDAQGHVAKGMFDLFTSLFHPPKKEEKQDEHERRKVLTVDEQTVKALEEKSSKVGFDVNIRLLASALTQTRADAILAGLDSAFQQFTHPHANGFTAHRLSGKQLLRLEYDFAFRNFSQSQRMILNTEELTSIFHFPTPYLDTKQIKSLKSRSAPMPSGMPETGIIIGTNAFRGEEKQVRLGADDRRRHLYIVGQTGTGKSVSMKNMIIQDIENGEGVCFIDPHGDAVEDVLAHIPKHRADDVVVFDPGDLERPFGLNMLEYDPRFPEQKTFIVNEMISIFDKLYDLSKTGGPMFEQYMRNALLLIMADPASGSTLLEVPRVFSDPVFRKLKLAGVSDPVVKAFWEKEAEKAGGEASLANITPYVTSKFNTFVANEFVRPIIAQQESSINFREAMDAKKIVLVNLAKGRVGEINSSLLGMIITGKILMAALSRTDIPEAERKDFYFYIDEFQNFATDSISVILSEARKYRLSLTVAHQFIAQLKESIKQAVFGNVGSMMIFRMGVEDAAFLEKQVAPEFGAHDIINLDNLNCYAKLLVNSMAVRPFNVAVELPRAGNAEIGRILKELSRVKYGTDRRRIELEIQERFKPLKQLITI